MCLASEPKYPPRKIERSRLTEPVCAEIEYWLSENAKRRMTGMRKQCLKKQDIHRALIEKGFTISYSSVCKYIQQRKAEKSKKSKDVFVKQYYEPGEECEFDWGEVKLRIGGKPVTFTMAVFALCHSESHCVSLCLTLYQRRHFSAFSLCLTLAPKTTVKTPKIYPKICSGVEIGYKNS